MLKYILTIIISFFGLLVGSLILFMASEEQKPGKEYFVFAQNASAALIAALLLFFYNIDVFIILLVSLAVFVLLYLIKSAKKSLFAYPLIGFVFYLFSASSSFLINLSLLAFIYGMATAFLLVNTKDKKTAWRIALWHLPFFITALLPLLISYL